MPSITLPVERGETKEHTPVPLLRTEGTLSTTERIETLSVVEVAHRCAQETAKYMKHLDYDDRYGLELFARAIVWQNEEAWHCIYTLYQPLVLTWVTQHSAWPQLMHEGSEGLINAIFAKFYAALRPAKFAGFGSLAAILGYLKTCVHSVLRDETRSWRQQEDSLDALEYDAAIDEANPETTALPRESAQILWNAVLQEVTDPTERRVFVLSYLLDARPAEVVAEHPELATTVDDVYRIKRNVMERLRRSRTLRAVREGMYANNAR